METIKSKVLMAHEAQEQPESPHVPDRQVLDIPDVFDIYPVECYNDFAAVVQLEMNAGGIFVPEGADLGEPYGIVIGFGPGLPNNIGGRIASQLKLGDLVRFQKRSIITPISLEAYSNRRVVIISERNILCKLSNVNHIVHDPGDHFLWK